RSKHLAIDVACHALKLMRATWVNANQGQLRLWGGHGDGQSALCAVTQTFWHGVRQQVGVALGSQIDEPRPGRQSLADEGSEASKITINDAYADAFSLVTKLLEALQSTGIEGRRRLDLFGGRGRRLGLTGAWKSNRRNERQRRQCRRLIGARDYCYERTNA